MVEAAPRPLGEGFFTSEGGVASPCTKSSANLLRSYLRTAKQPSANGIVSNRSEEEVPSPLLSPRALVPSANDVDTILNSVYVKLACKNVPNRLWKRKKKLHPVDWNGSTKAAQGKLKILGAKPVLQGRRRQSKRRRKIKLYPENASSEQNQEVLLSPEIRGSGYDLEATRLALERDAQVDSLRQLLSTAESYGRGSWRKVEKSVQRHLSGIRELGIQLVRRLVRLQSNHGNKSGSVSTACKLVHRFTYQHDHMLGNFQVVDGKSYLVRMQHDLDFLEPSLDMLKRLNLVNLHLRTLKRNPFVLLLNLDALYEAAVDDVDCPEGSLWRLLLKPGFRQELAQLPASCQDVYYAALVVARECHAWCVLNDVDKNAKEISPEEQEQQLLSACINKSKHCYAGKGSWLSVKRKQGESILPLAPFVQTKARKLFEEERTNLEVAMQQREAKEKLNREASTTIQGFLRRHMRQRNVQHFAASLKIQRAVRSRLARKHLRLRRLEAFQRHEENRVARWLTQVTADSVILQCWWRQNVALREMIRRRHRKRAIVLQAWWRMCSGLFRYRHYLAARIIQCCVRSFKSRAKLAQLVQERTEKEACILLQTNLRAYFARAAVHRLRSEVKAILIQALARGYAARMRFAKQRGALIVQRNVRGFIARQSFQILKWRHYCCLKIQTWWRGLIAGLLVRARKKLSEWQIQQFLSSFHQVYLCYSRHLRTLGRTLELQEALKRILNICRKALEHPGRIQKIGTIKLKRSIVRQLAYTRLYDEERVASETTQYKSRLAQLRRKRMVLEEVVLQRIKLQESIEDARVAEQFVSSCEGHDRILHSRMLRKITTLEGKLRKAENVEIAATNKLESLMKMKLRHFKGMVKHETLGIRRYEAERCSRGFGTYLRQHAARIAVENQKERIRQLEKARLQGLTWNSMKSEDELGHKLRGYLSCSRETLKTIRGVFDEFDADKSDSIDPYEFQQLAFSLGSTLSLKRVEKIMAEDIGTSAEGHVNFVGFSVWWLCNMDKNDPQIGNRMKVTALKAKLKMKLAARKARNLIRIGLLKSLRN